MLLCSLAAASCAGTLEPAPKPVSPGSDVLASRSVRTPDTPGSGTAPEHYQCGDVVMSDQLTSGGERMVQTVPCWDSGEEQIAHADYVAELQRARRANVDRATPTVTAVSDDERTACRGLSERELEHSPMTHRRAIAEVVPHREAGALRGVRIVWKPVPGLTADWMRRSIACHRARFERLGESQLYQPDDPTLVARAQVTVEQRRGHLEVLIETQDASAGQVALDRARDLVRPRTAIR